MPDIKSCIGDKVGIWTNQETGEVCYVREVDFRIGKDSDFEKIWLGAILALLDIIGGKRKDIVYYLLKNRTRADNVVYATYRKIATDCNISIKTVTDTMKKLKEKKIITQISLGCYRLSPNIIWRGSGFARQAVLAKFSSEIKEDTTKD